MELRMKQNRRAIVTVSKLSRHSGCDKSYISAPMKLTNTSIVVRQFHEV